MSTQAEAVSSPPYYGRRVAEQARRLGISPATIVRHIRRGKRLSDGSVARIAATVMPGGYRITDEAIDRFYALLTTDRLGSNGGQPLPSKLRTGGQADAQLAHEGW